jgi:hypothetical protein
MDKCPKCGADLIDGKCAVCEEKSFSDANGQTCQIIFINRETYLLEERPYANEHA